VSYTGINGMRSARYPLQGMGGCGCAGMAGCGCSGMGAEEGPPKLVGVIAVGVIGFGLVWYMARTKLASNRRRRRRRRR
jgi:hypothetical protein